MPDTLEWLVEHPDALGETVYDHVASREDAIEFLRKLIGEGKTGSLYQRVPFTTRVDVTVQARRTRKKKESTEGAATPRAEEPTTKDAAAQEPAPSPVVAPAEPTASLSLWVCEAGFLNDPACPGPAEFDPVTRGRFCGFHLVQVPEGHRREMHRIHGHRNRPHEAMVRLVG